MPSVVLPPLVETLIALLDIESPTGGEETITAYLKTSCASLKPFGLSETGKVQAYATPVDPEKKTVAFYGHTDTVANQQDREPFADGEWVWGCGASDMKGGLAVMLELMKSYEPETSRFNLQFVFYDAEEGPYEHNGLRRALPQIEALRKADLALVLEPTLNGVQTGCLGAVNRKVRIRGKSGHSARPWEGDNAIQKAWKLLKKLADFQPVEHVRRGVSFYEVCNATLVSGGKRHNILPDSCDLLLNYRFPPGWSNERARKELEAKFSGGEVEFLSDEISPAGEVCFDHPLLAEWTREKGLKIEAKQAWTDIAQLTAVGVPAVNFGPGDPAQAHQANEKIAIADLEACFELLGDFIHRT